MLIDRVHIIKKMLETGIITRSILSQVIITCRARRIEILRVLVNYAGMTSGQVQTFFHDHFGLTTVDLDDIVLNRAVVRLVPAALAMTHRIIPAFKVMDKTHLAVADPLNLEGLKAVQEYIGKKSRIFLSSEEQVLKAIREFASIAPGYENPAIAKIPKKPD